MKFVNTFLLSFIMVLSYGSSVFSQTIPKEELIFFFLVWKGDRFPDVRPNLADGLLERAK